MSDDKPKLEEKLNKIETLQEMGIPIPSGYIMQVVQENLDNASIKLGDGVKSKDGNLVGTAISDVSPTGKMSVLLDMAKEYDTIARRIPKISDDMIMTGIIADTIRGVANKNGDIFNIDSSVTGIIDKSALPLSVETITPNDVLHLSDKFRNTLIANSLVANVCGMSSWGWFVMYALMRYFNRPLAPNKGTYTSWPLFEVLRTSSGKDLAIVLRIPEEDVNNYKEGHLLLPLVNITSQKDVMEILKHVDPISCLSLDEASQNLFDHYLEDCEAVYGIEALAKFDHPSIKRRSQGVRRFLSPPYRLGTVKDIWSKPGAELLEEFESRISTVDDLDMWAENRALMVPEFVKSFEKYWLCETLAVFEGNKLLGYAFAMKVHEETWLSVTRVTRKVQYLADFLLKQLATQIKTNHPKVKYLSDGAVGLFARDNLGLAKYKFKLVNATNGMFRSLLNVQLKKRWGFQICINAKDLQGSWHTPQCGTGAFLLSQKHLLEKEDITVLSKYVT